MHGCSEVASQHACACAMEDIYPVWVGEERRDTSVHAVGQGICRWLDTGLQAEHLPSAQQIFMGCGQLSEGTRGSLGLPHCPFLRDTVKQEDDRQLAKKLLLIQKSTHIYRVNFNDQSFPFCHFSFSAKLKDKGVSAEK